MRSALVLAGVWCAACTNGSVDHRTGSAEGNPGTGGTQATGINKDGSTGSATESGLFVPGGQRDAGVTDTSPTTSLAPATTSPALTAGTTTPSRAPDAGNIATSLTPAPLTPFPLSTAGRFIVDRAGKRFKLASVNWYGAHDADYVAGGLDRARVDDIARAIKSMGFNSIRLPFSNAMLHRELAVDPRVVTANPDLLGKKPIEVYDRVVKALTDAGLVVILNNHTTHAMWCCSYDTDGLWYTSDYSAEQWIDDWVMMVNRYKANPAVAAADLRNEVRTANWNLPITPQWGTSQYDWRAAAEGAGNRIAQANPDLLIVVEGINYPRHHLKGVATNPIRLTVPNKLVYAAHNYGFIGPELYGTKYGEMDWATFSAKMEEEWGYVVNPNQPYTAPVWVSEFGEAYDSGNRQYFTNIIRYLKQKDLDFAFWALNPGPRTGGTVEKYCLLKEDWVTPLTDWRLDLLRSIQMPTMGP